MTDSMSGVTGSPSPQSHTPIASDPRIAQLERELASARQELAHDRRSRAIAEALREARAIDAEVAGAMLQNAIGGDGDVAQAVKALKARKPALFEATAPRPGVMSERTEQSADDATSGALREARRSGDRESLLRYLRLRASRRH